MSFTTRAAEVPADGTLSDEQRVTTLDRLVDEAKWGKSAMESSVLPEGKLDRETLYAAATYVRSHPDHGAFHALMALRRDDPAVYAEIPAERAAQILCDALAQPDGASRRRPAGPPVWVAGSDVEPHVRLPSG